MYALGLLSGEYSTEVADREGIPLQMGGQKWLDWNRPPLKVPKCEIIDPFFLHQ